MYYGNDIIKTVCTWQLILSATLNCSLVKYQWRLIMHMYVSFNYTFKLPEFLNHKHFVALFKQRLKDCFIEKWRADIESNLVLNTLYKYIKTCFGIEFYLENIISRKPRTMLTKLRVSAHYHYN